MDFAATMKTRPDRSALEIDHRFYATLRPIGVAVAVSSVHTACWEAGWPGLAYSTDGTYHIHATMTLASAYFLFYQDVSMDYIEAFITVQGTLWTLRACKTVRHKNMY